MRWITNARLMLQYAWNFASWRISGNITDSIFEVNAEMDPSIAEDKVRIMFQSLLAERLHAKVNVEVARLEQICARARSATV